MIPAGISTLHFISMNTPVFIGKIKNVYRYVSSNPHLLFVAIFLAYLILVFLSFRETYLYLGESAPEFCLSTACIEEIKKNYSGSISLAESLGWATTIFVTLLGAYLAFRSHTNSVTNSHISNHISHFNLFSDYLNQEIKKRGNLSASKIDTFSWYNFMFPLSRKGDLSVSKNYNNWILSLREILISTSDRVSSKRLNINHNIHQRKISSVLIQAGINLEKLPRRNFYSVEEELIQLIDSVNLMFLGSENLLVDIDRSYAV